MKSGPSAGILAISKGAIAQSAVGRMAMSQKIGGNFIRGMTTGRTSADVKPAMKSVSNPFDFLADEITGRRIVETHYIG